MDQIPIPVDVSPAEIAREKSFGGSIDLCAKAAGIEPKQLQEKLRWDKAQWSRWTTGGEGILWPKLVSLMDLCGNEAPLKWMLHQRHYDLDSLRHVETELERQNREMKEEIVALRRVVKGLS